MNRERQYSVQKAVRLRNLRLPEQLRHLTVPQCTALSEEIRRFLINTVLETGGHLASNLGVVELTLALHRNFQSPQDRIVWDVGHQAYVHKLLTGRIDGFSRLRKEGGLAGFPKPEESPHDAFITGHSSTAVSAAFGMAEAMRINGDRNHYAVAVVGDGAMTGGMFYEGLNNAGKSKSNLIVVLNDNNQAISKNVGAIAKYLAKIRQSTGYVRTKWKVESVIGKAPHIGDKLVVSLKNTKDHLRKNIMETTLFEDMGFVYLGPVDGHDIEALDEVLTVAKSYRRPVLVHVQTIKGKGYVPAEENPGAYHGVPPAEHSHADKPAALSYLEIAHSGVARIDLDAKDPELSVDECFSTVFGCTLAEFAKKDANICAVTAAMKYGTGLQFFAAAHPNRFFDVGIAEQHAVTFCAALASMGKLPVFAVYSSFLQRSFDQLLHDTAIAGYHVVLGVDRAGIVGEDGETHQGIFDIPMLTAIPGCKIYSPMNYNELMRCLEAALYQDSGLVAVRYPRGKEPRSIPLRSDTGFTHAPGSGMLLVTYGRITDHVFRTVQQLHEQNIPCGLLKLTTIFPIPKEALEAAKRYPKICFFEESGASGGISEKFSAALLDIGWHGQYRRCAIEGFVRQAEVERCFAHVGLSEELMLQSALELYRDEA